MKMVEALRQKSDLLEGKGLDVKTISAAEKELGLKFAAEYKEYLEIMSIAAYGGHELTGLTKSERTNVVSVTRKMKERYSNIPVDWYVVEDANIDDIVIWQDEKGNVYKTLQGSNAICIASSLAEFVINV